MALSQINWVPLIGVVIGFALSQIAGFITWRWSEVRQQRRVRTLVSLEIGHNTARLKDYWHNVTLPSDEPIEEYEEDEDGNTVLVRPMTKYPPPEEPIERLARRAIEIPFPVLSENAFQSQLGELPKALSEAQIREVWRFYEEIGDVKNIHDWLVKVNEEPSSEYSFPYVSRGMKSAGLISATFSSKKAGVVYDLRSTIERIIARDDPLSPCR